MVRWGEAGKPTDHIAVWGSATRESRNLNYRYCAIITHHYSSYRLKESLEVGGSSNKKKLDRYRLNQKGNECIPQYPQVLLIALTTCPHDDRRGNENTSATWVISRGEVSSIVRRSHPAWARTWEIHRQLIAWGHGRSLGKLPALVRRWHREGKVLVTCCL